jgi:2-polyprenyl-3-methyl-5-hydroxy-6-metoxy-1,4-benzoquinol methylase
MDYDALYKHRFKDVDQEERNKVWAIVSQYITSLVDEPNRVLDPACGLGEFINFCPASEKWAADMGMDGSTLAQNINFASGAFLDIELPEDYFDLIFLSNVLEHLPTQLAVNEFLIQARKKLRHGGAVIIMGPNFKYCANEYFDCADHTTVLTHVSVEEHLVAAGFKPIRTVARFLPYSFRSRLPSFRFTTRLYLKFPLAWRILGKQFLLVAVKE